MAQFLSSRKIRQDLSGTRKRIGTLHWVPDICWRKFRDDNEGKRLSSLSSRKTRSVYPGPIRDFRSWPLAPGSPRSALWPG